jgi:hypothetical protein
MSFADHVAVLDAGTLAPIMHLSLPGGQLCAGASERFYLSTPKGCYLVLPDLTSFPVVGASVLGGDHPDMALDLGTTLLAASGSRLALLDPVGGSVASGELSAAMSPAIREIAVSRDGAVYAANAMSWSSEDEMTEFYGHLIGCSISGTTVQTRFQHDRREHDLGLSTGGNIRLAAYDHGVVLGESGVAAFDGDGACVWANREWDSNPPLVVIPPRQLLHVAGDPRALVAQVLPRYTDDTVPPCRTVVRLPQGQSFKDVVATRGDRIYALTTKGVIAFDASGQPQFAVATDAAVRLACGNGYLLAVSTTGHLVRIG